MILFPLNPTHFIGDQFTNRQCAAKCSVCFPSFLRCDIEGDGDSEEDDEYGVGNERG